MFAPNNTPSLDDAKKSFEAFRKSKTSQGQRIPDALWEMTRALTTVHPHIKIRRTLKISDDLYQRYVLQKKTKPKKQQLIPLGIPIQARPIAKTTLPNGVIVEFLCANALSSFIGYAHATNHTPV